jgi:ribosomal protein L7/L12
MKLFTKVATGVLLGIGLPLTLIAAISTVNPRSTAEDREAAIAVLIFFGLPPAALGSYLLWSSYSQNQQETRDRLRSTFFQLLKEGQGHITTLRFAMETGLEGQAAKIYLDDRAREFSANFNVTEDGRISYFFDLGEVSPATLQAASASETFDVILEFVPSQARREVVKAIHDLTGLDWHDAKNMLKRQGCPLAIGEGVDKTTAEKFRRRLEAAGAEVIVVLK